MSEDVAVWRVRVDVSFDGSDQNGLSFSLPEERALELKRRYKAFVDEDPAAHRRWEEQMPSQVRAAARQLPVSQVVFPFSRVAWLQFTVLS